MEKVSDFVRKEYDKISQHYIKATGTKVFHSHYERPAMLALLNKYLPPKGKDIFEPGCASAWYTKTLLDMGARVTAVDISQKMVDNAIEQCGGRANICRMDIETEMHRLPDNSFDGVLGSLVFHYIADWDMLMAEMYRILRPGGVLLFSTHHPGNPFYDSIRYFDKQIINDRWSFGPREMDVRFYHRPMQDIVNPVINAGFRLKELHEAVPVPEMKEINPRVYNNLMDKPCFVCVVGVKG